MFKSIGTHHSHPSPTKSALCMMTLFFALGACDTEDALDMEEWEAMSWTERSVDDLSDNESRPISANDMDTELQTADSAQEEQGSRTMLPTDADAECALATQIAEHELELQLTRADEEKLCNGEFASFSDMSDDELSWFFSQLIENGEWIEPELELTHQTGSALSSSCVGLCYVFSDECRVCYKFPFGVCYTCSY
ncbi:MAG: hypothetical protein AAGF11_38230 [Myxococcota bacterium]